MSVDKERTERGRTLLLGRGMWQFQPRMDDLKRQKKLKLTDQVSRGVFVKTTALKKTFLFPHIYFITFF